MKRKAAVQNSIAKVVAPTPRVKPAAALLFTTAVAIPVGLLLWIFEALL